MRVSLKFGQSGDSLMSAGTPWSVKGIDSKAREVAKDLARRSGMTLGEWLNSMILQGEDVAAVIQNERQKPQYQSTPDVRSKGRASERVPQEPLEDVDYDDYEEEYAPRLRRPDPNLREARYAEPQSRPQSRPQAPAPRPDSRLDPRYENPKYASARPAPYSLSAQRQALPKRPYISADDYYDDARQTRSSSDDLGRVARVLETLGSRIETSETRSASAVRGVSQAVEALLNRLEVSESAIVETEQRLEQRLHGQTREVMDTVVTTAERLDRAEEDQSIINERLEAAERLVDAQAERIEGISGHLREERERVARLEAELKATQVKETVQAVEGALGKLANQLYENDARNRDSLKDVRQDMVGMSHRVAQMELRDPERAAQGLIDKVVTQLAQRLESAEAQTSTAIRSLEQAFTALDSRLSRAEERGDVSDPESVHSLSRLASDLTRRVEESRYEVMRALETSTRHTMDQTLTTLNSRLEAAEVRSAKAIETLGQDVVKIADNLSRRVTGVEQKSNEIIHHTTSEMGRLSDNLDRRLASSESNHAQALERLGGEIARISERLTLKISESERRTAQVLQGVSEELEGRNQRSDSDISERIRQSEERTQRLLDEAKSKIDSKLGQAHTKSLLQEALTKKPVQTEDESLPNPFAASSHYRSKPAPEPEDDFDITGKLLRTVTDFKSDHLDEVASSSETTLTSKPQYDPFEADAPESDEVMQAPLSVTAHKDAAFDDHDPFADVDESRKSSPPLRTSSDRSEFDTTDEDPFTSRYQASSQESSFESSGVSMSTRDALAAARAAVRASVDGPLISDKKNLSGLKFGASRTKSTQNKRSKSGNGTLGGAAIASSVAVVLTVAGMGAYLIMSGESQPSKSSASDIKLASAITEVPAAKIDLSEQDQTRLKAMYDSAVMTLKANDPKAVNAMKMVADQGYSPAQFQMSRIYEGENGRLVPPDKSQARLWSQRAAESGHALAMYNLGLMLYNGEGGAQDTPAATFWFRKAADLGVVDSYFNLGHIYMQGEGVPINLTESYKWFTISSKAGDSEAKLALAEIKPKLSEQQIKLAETEAAKFKPVEAAPQALAEK
jgi:localization factor PodJL